VSADNQFDPDKYAEDLKGRVHADIRSRMARRRGVFGAGQRKGVVPGVILVAIGSIILLDHMGIIASDRLWRFWPVILVVVGAVKFFQESNRAFGAVLMVIGGIFLSSNLGFTRLNWDDLWPLVLIAAGVGLIWSRFELPRLPKPLGPGGQPAGPGGPNMINEYAMFGGVERRVNISNFAGGSATAIFGGVELDFRSADIEGEEAVLYVEAIFGGIEIVVLERWTVVYEGQSIFGGYSDETRPPLPDVPGAAPKKRLVLRGRAVFGGISVKN
jgi:hypothetical protein